MNRRKPQWILDLARSPLEHGISTRTDFCPMPNNAITHDLFISTFLPRLLPLLLPLPFSTATRNTAAYRHMTQQLPILPCAENSPDTPDGGSILPLWSYNTMSSIHPPRVYRPLGAMPFRRVPHCRRLFWVAKRTVRHSVPEFESGVELQSRICFFCLS